MKIQKLFFAAFVLLVLGTQVLHAEEDVLSPSPDDGGGYSTDGGESYGTAEPAIEDVLGVDTEEPEGSHNIVVTPEGGTEDAGGGE